MAGRTAAKRKDGVADGEAGVSRYYRVDTEG